MKLIIKRSEWLRGEGETDSYLLRSSDEKKCCLGFLALQCGASAEQITDRTAPIATRSVIWPNEMFTEDDSSHSHHCLDLMKLNDARNISAENREFALKDIFNYIGIDVEFID